jgi:1-aminocyclopropane-1-carboxylate deaminase/D-cysteine desulfhydrase-like pyridoxal-dependent ACC family enzyme
MTPGELRRAIERFPSISLASTPTPVEPLPRLSASLGVLPGGGPRLLIKRDDAIPFGFGGNKVRKLALVAARAQAERACTLITAGAVQSNHARVTAAVAAKLGMRAMLVVNRDPPLKPTANALLDALLGAEVVYVRSRDERTAKMREIADSLRADGRHPFEIPVGASTPLGALGYVLAMAELVDQMPPPDVIMHSTSSGGTQAGLVAGCRLLGLKTQIIGVSADDSSALLQATVNAIMAGMAGLLHLTSDAVLAGGSVEIDDRFVGGGYGIATEASREAIEITARTEAIFLDPTYTAKAMAALIAYVRQRRFPDGHTVLFWHTGGQVGLFA